MNVVYAVRQNYKLGVRNMNQALTACLGGLTVPNTTAIADDCDLLIHWGFSKTRALQSAISLKIPFVILDKGYFDPDRRKRISVSFNGHNGLSMAVDGVLDLPPRWHPTIQPWREGGTTVQIIGQVANDASLRGQIMQPWMNRTAIEAVDAYQMKVIKRPHPREVSPWETQQVPLEDTFDDTHVSISWSSTSAVQTVLAGVRSVIMHRASPAYGMGSSSIGGSLRMPGRIAWAHELSHRQYDLLDSVDAGECAEYILRGLPQATREAEDGIYDTEGLK